MKVLRTIDDPFTANLVLNSVALLQDSKLGYPFDMREFNQAAWAKDKKGYPMRRLKYFAK